MADDKEKLVKDAVDLLKPEIGKTMKALLDTTLNEKLPVMKDGLGTELWDKACAEIGKQLKMPVETIKNLVAIETLVKEKGAATDKILSDLTSKVDQFKEKLKFVDITQTVTMSYSALQNKLTKYSVIFTGVGVIIGYLFGLVWMLWGRAIWNGINIF